MILSCKIMPQCRKSVTEDRNPNFSTMITDNNFPSFMAEPYEWEDVTDENTAPTVVLSRAPC